MISLFLPRSRARAAWPPAVALLISAACSATAIDPGSLTRDPAPSRLTSPPLAFTQIGMGDGHTCAITATGTAWCWGWNASGQLGDGSETDSPIPVQVNTTQRFTGIAVGGDHACGLTAAGEAWCWGGNFFGELGDGTDIDHIVPVKVVGGLTFQQLTASEFLTCGIARSSGAQYCWGSLNNDLSDSALAAPILGPTPLPAGMTFSHLTAGLGGVCGLADGANWCVGFNKALFGNGGTQSGTGDPTVFVKTSGGLAFTEVSLGGSSGCGRTTSNSTYCWGNGVFGNDYNATPIAIAGVQVITAIATGWEGACGLQTSGIPICWGTDFVQAFPVYRPPAQLGSTAFTQIAAGNGGFCALTVAGAAWCWGQNYWGALGDGTTTSRTTPVPVVGP